MAGLLEYLDALRKSSPTGAGAGQLTENEARRLMQGGMDGSSVGVGMGNLTEAEAARLSQLLMQQQMDEFSRQNAFMSNPRAAQGYQQSNPLGNTMTNIAPQAGGMAVRQAPMDLNTLLRMISR
jgi:hypothetical protein